MTDKQVRKLKKTELIEMLYYARKEIDTLKTENTELKNRLDTIIGTALKESPDALNAVVSENNENGK